MNITVRDVRTTPPSEDELTPAQATDAFLTHCLAQSRTDGAHCGQLGWNACQTALCHAEAWLCVAQAALESTGPAGMVLSDISGPAYEVQPQDAESKVALAHAAQIAVAKSMEAASHGLIGPSCEKDRFDTTTIWIPTDPTALEAPAMERFASTLAEALYVGERAADQGTAQILAVADRDATDIGDAGRAARLTWFGTSLSRVLAAQAQVGGTSFGTVLAPTNWELEAGEYDDPVLLNVGIGVVPRCGVNCTRALTELRQSGINFKDLVADRTAPYELSASVAQLNPLIAQLAGNLNSRIAHDAAIYAGSNAEEFAASIGVTVADLLQAVEQMRYEDVVYTRPRGVSLANPPRLAPKASGVQQFGSDWDPTTLSGPVPPPAMHYITRARAGEAWTGAQPLVSDRSLRLPPLRPERAHLFAYARAVASEALHVSYVTNPVEGGDATIALNSIIQDATARRALDVEVCAWDATNLRVRVFGLTEAPDSSEFQLVQGLDGLRCAVQGTLAGQPCSDQAGRAEFIAPGEVWKDVHQGSSDPRQSRRHAVQFEVKADGAFYVVRRRPGAAGGYGAYEAVAGFTSDVDAGMCTTFPYDWMSYKEAASIFDFSDDARASSRRCAGVPERLPLEDEIIDDGDGYEDSWQHHLRIASAAASHADQLGQDLIASGLSMDQASEQHIDELQRLCGTHVNIDRFGGTHVDTSVSCDEGAGDCPPGFTCIGKTCVSASILGAEDSAQRAALEDCLGLGEGGEIVSVVALGPKPLCAWRDLDHPEQLCSGHSPCPYLMDPAAECEATPSGQEAVVIANGEVPAGAPENIGDVVGLVGSVGPDGDNIPGTNLPRLQCDERVLDALKKLRGTPTSRSYWLSVLQRSGFFSYANVREVARRIGWVGEVGNFSHLRVDGGPLRNNAGTIIGSTGSAVSGTASNAWPCGQSASGDTTTPGDAATALTDRWVDCGDVSQRAAMNWRIGRAAAVLTAFTDNGLGNHRMPAFYYQSNDANLNRSSTSGARLLTPARDFKVASQAEVGGHDLTGQLYGILDAANQGEAELWRSANGVRVIAHAAGEDGRSEAEYFAAYSNTTRPIGFLDFGYEVNGNDNARASAIAERLWEGLGGISTDDADLGTSFFNIVNLDDSDLDESLRDDALKAARGRIFLRALTRGGDTYDTVYVYHHRNATHGHTAAKDLTYLFNSPVWDAGGRHNTIHLFPNSEQGTDAAPEFADQIVRRDLLDAMELACFISMQEPPPSNMIAEEDRPNVTSADDVGEVEHYANRIAAAFDAMARVQIVRDIPRDVVERLRAEAIGDSESTGSATTDRVTGDYGAMLSTLRSELRTMGESPANIGRIIRQIGSDLRVLKEKQRIFDREQTKIVLQSIVRTLQALSSCLSAAMSAISSDATSAGRVGMAAGICAAQIAIAALGHGIDALAAENIEAQRTIEVETWAKGLADQLDALSSERTAFLNAVDQVQTTAGKIRDTRTAARSSLARALFLSSDAAGRQFATNTVMRRLYDINFQRYNEALEAAIRSGAVARFAIEQRFGINLETQQCTQLVDKPSTWANDICTATGVNYGALRDPDVEFDEATIRQMFIGDYVRRLEQYVESYRFDYPYQSGDDVMVMSLRDDVVRAPSRCIERVSNWLGSSNDLFAGVLPNPDGSPVRHPDERPYGTEEPAAAWMQRGCSGEPPYENCLALTEVQGPQFKHISEDPGLRSPVSAVSSSHAPRGYEIRFAPTLPGESYVGDYQNGASYTQALVLPAGVYRLSWYEQSAGTTATPVVDITNVTSSSSGPIVAASRPLTDGWTRKFRIVEIPPAMTAQVALVGVFASDVASSEEQALRVAGMQLEHVSGTSTEDAWRMSSLDPDMHGPTLFAATTAPGYGYVDGCVLGDPSAFRNAWRYGCAQLCSGGFSGHCDPGERAQQFCYWELPFSLNEDRLLSRGGDFGGGFAFGNYNYRSGEIAVNVVGTGVRDCAGGGSDACYSTASVPFSLIHTAPAASTIGGGSYSIRAHDGSLHPVDLFDGRIESARALVAERYMTNPLSSADAALINDYTRAELRGRPMTGNYRLLVWDNGSVNFGAIEDVQIVWRYRYFTRTGNAYVCDE